MQMNSIDHFVIGDNFNNVDSLNLCINAKAINKDNFWDFQFFLNKDFYDKKKVA